MVSLWQLEGSEVSLWQLEGCDISLWQLVALFHKGRATCKSTKVCLVKAMVFPVVMYGCESWAVKKAEHRRIDAFECTDPLYTLLLQIQTGVQQALN